MEAMVAAVTFKLMTDGGAVCGVADVLLLMKRMFEVDSVLPPEATCRCPVKSWTRKKITKEKREDPLEKSDMIQDKRDVCVCVYVRGRTKTE